MWGTEAKVAALKEKLTSSTRMGREANHFHSVRTTRGAIPNRAGGKEEGGSEARMLSVKGNNLFRVLKESQVRLCSIYQHVSGYPFMMCILFHMHIILQ